MSGLGDALHMLLWTAILEGLATCQILCRRCATSCEGMGTRGLGNANLMTVINGKSVNHMNGNYDGDVFFVFALFGWICWEVQIEMM